MDNLPVISKKVWNLVRVAYFLLRKGISKSKLMLDLNMMMKRGKIAGKAISNLMFHHHYGGGSGSSSPTPARRSNDSGHLPFDVGADEYEFSCSNSPAFPGLHFPGFHGSKRRRNQHHNSFFACAHAPDTLDDDTTTVNAVKAVMEILNNHGGESPVQASPALPGFGRTPRVRQLRITDSPFPLQDANADPQVDIDADEFISRFYKELRLQKTTDEN